MMPQRRRMAKLMQQRERMTQNDAAKRKTDLNSRTCSTPQILPYLLRRDSPPPVFASKDQLPKYCKLQYKCQFLLIFHWKCRDIMENCPRNRIIFYCKMAFMLKFAVSTDCAPESSRPAGTTLQTSRAPPDRPSNLPPNEPGKEGTSG